MYNYAIKSFVLGCTNLILPTSPVSVKQQKSLGPVSQTALAPCKVGATLTFPLDGQKVTTLNRYVFLTQHLRSHSPLTTPQLLHQSCLLTRICPLLSIKLDLLWPPRRSEDPSLSAVLLKCRTLPRCSSQNCPTSRTVQQTKLYQTGAKARTPKTVNQTGWSRYQVESLPLPPYTQRGLLMSSGWIIILPLMRSQRKCKVFPEDFWYKCVLWEMSVLTALWKVGLSAWIFLLQIRYQYFSVEYEPILILIWYQHAKMTHTFRTRFVVWSVKERLK